MAYKSKDLPPHVRAMMRREDKARRRRAAVSAPAHDVITIELPLPAKSLSPNARVHWAVKARDVKAYRQRAASRVRCLLGGAEPQWETVTSQATFYHASNRRRDNDNLNASLKSAQDGLVDGGLLSDDEHVTPLPPVKLIDRDRPRVEITITKQGD